MTDETPDRFQLLIDLAGPGYRDQIIFEADDEKKLEPQIESRDGVKWEIYADPDGGGDWIEVPQKLIVKREFFKVPKQKSVTSLFEHTEQRLGHELARPERPEPRRSVK